MIRKSVGMSPLLALVLVAAAAGIANAQRAGDGGDASNPSVVGGANAPYGRQVVV